MPKPMRRRRRAEWPAWRFGPDGDKALFDCPEDVPAGWTDKPQLQFERPEAKPLPDKADVVAELQKRKIEIDPRWGLGKLIEVLNDN